MKALIFAAGLGERMRPLTDRTPKPLLPVGGKPLIAWHLEKLAACGIQEVVINVSWLADQFPQALGDGSRWGLRIHYSHEGATPLETGGGMLHALPLLSESPGSDESFMLVNGDIWTDFDFASLPREPQGLAHLVMVEPASHAPEGDFALDAEGYLRSDGPRRLTYAGLGVFRPRLLEDWRGYSRDAGADEHPPRFRLAPILRAHMATGQIRGEHHPGRWTDVGTPQRLADLEVSLGGRAAGSAP